MGFILTLFCISFVTILVVYVQYGSKSALNTFCVFTIGSVALCLIILASSYTSYLRMMEDKVTIEQHAAVVLIYSGQGVRPFIFGQAISKELTDFKFSEYQGKLHDLIVSLRGEIASYNDAVVSKTIMKKNRYWNMVIYMPDTEMKPIEMMELLSDMKKDKRLLNK